MGWWWVGEGARGAGHPEVTFQAGRIWSGAPLLRNWAPICEDANVYFQRTVRKGYVTHPVWKEALRVTRQSIRIPPEGLYFASTALSMYSSSREPCEISGHLLNDRLNGYIEKEANMANLGGQVRNYFQKQPHCRNSRWRITTFRKSDSDGDFRWKYCGGTG